MELLKLFFLISTTLAMVQVVRRQGSIIAPGFYPPFSEYISLFNKTYSDQEYAKRQTLYNLNVREIIDHNSQPDTGYLQAVNNFTDWNQSELKRLTSYRLNQTNRQEGEQITRKFREEREKTTNRRLDATNLDWRTLGAVTPVRDQGSCGSCWAFAAIAAAESWAITLGNANNTIALSQQFPLRCTPNCDCNGGYAQDAASVIAAYGCPNRTAYPYSPSNTSTALCRNATSYTKVATGRNVYYDLTDDEIIALLQTSPITVDVYSSSWYNYYSGVLSCGSNATYADHVVLLVGYTPTYWIIKNQWGTSWGLRGYGYITRSRTNRYTNCLVGSGIVQYKGNPVKKFERTAIWVLTTLLVILLAL